MKKIQYILFCLIPLLAMQSCMADWVENDLTLDGKISTTISVTVPQLPDAHPQTRAMAVNPRMQNLYVAVFDENGLLLEYVKADEEESEMAIKNGTTYNYKVSLKPTTDTTYVHFIGNSPVTSLDFGHERDLMKNLYTENGEEAYWQRKKVDGGINASTTALTGVKLIRNFAWINVISTDENFIIDSYCIVNTRTAGSVAPYNANNNQFVTFSDNKTYATITGSGEGYNGFIPSNAQINSEIPAENQWFSASSESSNTDYAYFVYEREKALSNPSFILLKATYKGTSNRYYKVDLRDSIGNYFPIVRNFKYRINITSVGHSGYGSAEAAANGSGSGDVSSSIETKSFNNISNGDERLFVSYTDTTLVEQSTNVKLRYKYIVYETDNAGNVREVNKTDTATVTTTGDVIPVSSEGYNYAITAGTGEWAGWNEITFSTTELTAANKTQTFVITGTNDGSSLQRTVNITLRNKYTMEIECDPFEIPADMGKAFDVIVKVPGGLGRSMFPLDIQLEAENQSMTPNLGDNLPTVTGPSIVPEKNKTTIGYIKQLSWVDYEAFFNENQDETVMPVRCHFKSNKTNVVGSTTTIYASNKYFNQANDDLGYFDAEQFTNLMFSTQNENLPSSINQNITFTFNMTALPSSVAGSDSLVTVALYNLKLDEDDTNGLTQTGSDAAKGIAYYTFKPTSTNVALKLQNTDVNVEAKVVLSSYHFESAEKAMNYTKGRFTDLSLTSTDKYLAKDAEVTFKFRLSRQVKQGRYVTVTLGNLVPADSESLTVIDEKAGTYRFDPKGNTDITLNLKVKNSYQTVSADLSADYFEDNSATPLQPSRGTFSGLTLSATDAKLTEESTVTCSFNVPAELPGGYILITLDNLVTSDGKTSYKYVPEANELGKPKTFTFKVEESYTPVTVTLSADCFESVSTSLNPVIQIPARNIKFDSSFSNPRNYTFSIYATNPGTSTNVTAIGSFTPSRSGNTYSNPDAIDVGEYYQTIMDREGEDKGYIFIRYSSRSGGRTTYYVAKVSLEELMGAGVTLESTDFTRQY